MRRLLGRRLNPNSESWVEGILSTAVCMENDIEYPDRVNRLGRQNLEEIFWCVWR